jgi:hypothetical protein
MDFFDFKRTAGISMPVARRTIVSSPKKFNKQLRRRTTLRQSVSFINTVEEQTTKRSKFINEAFNFLVP